MRSINIPIKSANAPAEQDKKHWIALDDRDEWASFSEPMAHATPDVWQSQLAVEGMHCAACGVQVERALMNTAGVISAKVNAASGRASLTWNAQATKPSVWMQAVSDAGYRALPAADAFKNKSQQKAQRLMLWRLLVAGFCMMQVMMYAYPTYISRPGDMALDVTHLMHWASWVLTLPVMFFSCGPFFQNAWRDIQLRQISMDMPVAIGIIVTFMVSSAATFNPQGWWGGEVYFDSLTMFVFFLLCGRWLEVRLRNKTANSLDALMRKLPESTERVNTDGTLERVAVRRLQVGDIVNVLVGESFPADGELLSGETQTDEALLTGESKPIVKVIGDTIIAGSHNLTAPVRVKVTQIGKSTRYAQIVALMEKVATEKPRLALLADRIAKPFLFGVLIAAALSAAYWWSTSPSHALMIAVAVLIVTCPCALSLATPSAMLATAGALARNGVLIRNLQSIESLSEIDTVIFDKTGTLTQDQIKLGNITTRTGIEKALAFALAQQLAQHSMHPVSRAFQTSNPEYNADISFSQVQEIAGKGMTAQWQDNTLRLGSADFCDAPKIDNEGMQVHLADNFGWMASFDLEEHIREDAATSIQLLKNSGLHLEVLSGDRTSAVKQVAEKLDIATVKGNCSPQDKLAHIQALQQQGRRVAMVGDGLNDGPVLMSANVSIAMGHAVPIAQAKSDMIVLNSQLQALPLLIHQAQRTMNIVKQNLVWAALYNAICVPLAMFGLLPAWLAGIGMATSSLFVVLNAARLARISKPVQST